jgi:DNA-binding NtrC family response regulator
MPLAKHFIEKYCIEASKQIDSVSDECISLLINYDWPGNVRELEKAIERAIAVCKDHQIIPEHLPSKIKGHKGGNQ